MAGLTWASPWASAIAGGRLSLSARINQRCSREALNVQCKQPNPDSLQVYDVKLITPPPQHLGTFKFPKNTQCGELIELPEGRSYVVSSVCYRYKLSKGRYKPDTKRLLVTQTSRYFLNMQLDELLNKA
eukprot:jgi/Mesvir1/29639/Mv21487-RA.1